MTRLFKVLGWLEGVSFLTLLLIAMPVKYYADNPSMVKLLGPLHGGLFLTYCLLAFLLASSEDWPIKKHLLAYLAAVVPFGTFWFERKYLKDTGSIAAAAIQRF